MNEFIDKLISRLDEEKQENPCRNTQCKDCKYTNECYEGEKSFKVGFDNIEAIVTELAGEYKLFGNSEQVKVSEMPTGWIPCSERLPKILQWVLIQTTQGDMDVVRYNGETECWGNDFYHRVHPRMVIAWQPLPAPYTEGE